MRVAAIALVVVVAAVGAGAARAAVPTWTNSCAGDINPAACERLTFIAETDDAIAATVSAPSGSSSTDTDTTTLTAWGVWFLAGVVLVSLFAQRWHSSWRFWRD
jgi:hypothetical protein